MFVRFIGYTDTTIDEPWFTVGKEYEVIADKRDCDDPHVWVIDDDNEPSPMFEGEFEIVSE